jgi:hypothetical protein
MFQAKNIPILSHAHNPLVMSANAIFNSNAPFLAKNLKKKAPKKASLIHRK